MSKHVFNSLHRIDLALSARSLCSRADSSEFDLEELVVRTGVSRSAVHREVKLLVEIGALSQASADRRVVYSVVEGPFWDLIKELVRRSLDARPDPPSADGKFGASPHVNGVRPSSVDLAPGDRSGPKKPTSGHRTPARPRTDGRRDRHR